MTQFTSKQWVKGLSELQIQPKYTAIRNPCANLAERINRQLGNMFRIFVGEQHTKWSRFITTVSYTHLISETDKEKETRLEELRSHIAKVKEGQERLQRQLANAEVGSTARTGGPHNNCLLYTSNKIRC